MPTVTTKFTVGDIVYLRAQAEVDGKMYKAIVEEVIVEQSYAPYVPPIIRYRIFAGGLVQRGTRWLEQDLSSYAEAKDLACKALHRKTVEAENREHRCCS